MKLISITWRNVPRMAGLRAGDTVRIDCDTPPSPLKDWKAVVRGSQIFFVSPAGWSRDQSVKTRDTSGQRVAFGPIALSEACLEWCAESDADVAALIDGKLKHDSPPFGWRPAPILTDKPILDQIPQGQMGDV